MPANYFIQRLAMTERGPGAAVLASVGQFAIACRMYPLHPAWRVAAITFLVLLVAAGLRSAPSVLIVPLEQEFGWSRATTGFAVGLNILLFGLTGPFAAAILERFGMRRTVAASLLILSAGVALTPLMRESWHMVALWGVVVGGASGVTALVLAATVANRWFVARRGLVMGVLTASTATGQLVFLPVFAQLVQHVGWRAVSLLLACVAAALIVPVWLMMRDRPSDLGLPPYGGTAIVPRTSLQNPVGRAIGALRTGMGQRDFWLLAGTFFVCGASTNGLIGTHLIPACLDSGWVPAGMAAGLLAAMGVFDMIGTTLSGWLSDRMDNRTLLAWYYALRGLSLLFLPFALAGDVIGATGLAVFAVFYGLDWIATVPPTVRLAARSFGEDNAPVMFAWIVCAHQLGASVAAYGAGVVRVNAGSYGPAFLGAGALCLVASILSLMIGRQPVVRGTAAVTA